MSADQHDPAAHDEHEHGDENGHGDEHGHGDHSGEVAALGPIDVAAWGAGLLGLIISVAIAACFVLATATLA